MVIILPFALVFFVFIAICEVFENTKQTHALIDTMANMIYALAPIWILALHGSAMPNWMHHALQGYYGVLLATSIFSWWIPALCELFNLSTPTFTLFRLTPHHIPYWRENILPITFHVFMHAIMLICFTLSLKN